MADGDNFVDDALVTKQDDDNEKPKQQMERLLKKMEKCIEMKLMHYFKMMETQNMMKEKTVMEKIIIHFSIWCLHFIF